MSLAYIIHIPQTQQEKVKVTSNLLFIEAATYRAVANETPHPNYVHIHLMNYPSASIKTVLL